MSVHYDKDRKTWIVRWRETNPRTGESKNRNKRGFSTKKEALRYETELNDKKEFMTFEDLMEEYLASLQGYSIDYTINQKRSKLRLYADEFMKKDVRKIDRKMLIQWTTKLSQLDKSINVKNKCIQYFRAVSRFGHNIHDFTDFAAPLKYFPQRSGDVRQMNIISPQEFQIIMDNCPKRIYRLYYTFLYHTGLRRGEALGILKSDIQRNRVSINKSIGESQKGFGRLKNGSSERIIALDTECMSIVEELKPLEGDFLFGGIAPLPFTNIERNWKKALKSAGMPSTYRIHDIRHSFISNAIGNGIDIVTVSKYVGHRDIKETLNTYSHSLRQNEDKMISTMESIY